MGFPRHLSQHVGGFVIARDLVERMVPVENAAMAERTVLQWDKDDLDALGLLKVDCLALGMLSAIRRALAMVSQYRGTRLTMQDIPSEDPEVYAMCQRADTIGVFQIESRAQQSMLPRLKPACFYDLVIEVAIVRPGPIQGGMVHPYLRRREGMEPVTYPSEAVKSVLERTLGVPIFQEQVMQLAIVAAGFTPGEADHLRRSMAAWRRKGGLEKFEQRLIDGMAARGYTEAFARQIYQQILGFGEYGFPESHSASFALLVYVSAWLKRYEPAAFCGALLNSLPMGFYGPSQLVSDARRHGVEVRPVDATVSEWDCTLEKAGRRRLRCASVFASSPGSPKRARSVWSKRGRRGLLRALPISRIARNSTSATSPASPRPTRSRRSPAIATAPHGRSPASSGCRRSSMATRSRKPLPRCRRPPKGRTSSPITGSSRSRCAGIRSRCCATGCGGRRLATASEIAAAPQGRIVRTAGIVIGRQRPDTASGVIFVTLEDETGATNVIVWRDVERPPAPRAARREAPRGLREDRARGRGRPRARRTARRSFPAARSPRNPIARFSLTRLARPRFPQRSSPACVRFGDPVRPLTGLTGARTVVRWQNPNSTSW